MIIICTDYKCVQCLRKCSGFPSSFSSSTLPVLSLGQQDRDGQGMGLGKEGKKGKLGRGSTSARRQPFRSARLHGAYLLCPLCPFPTPRVRVGDKALPLFPLGYRVFRPFDFLPLVKSHRHQPTFPTSKPVALRYCTLRHVTMSEPCDQFSFAQLLNDESLPQFDDDWLTSAIDMDAQHAPAPPEPIQEDVAMDR